MPDMPLAHTDLPREPGWELLLQQWIAEYGGQLLAQPLTEDQGEPYQELVRKLWECWKYHWMAERRFTKSESVDGVSVARRIRDGMGLGGGSLGGDVIHDLVWVDGVLRGDPRAIRAFFQQFDDFAVAVARKTSPRYAHRLDWWDDLKATLVIREERPGKLANYQGHSGLKAWLGRIFVREIMHYAERDRREATTVEALAGVADAKAVAAGQFAADQVAAERDCRGKVRLALQDSLESLEDEHRQALLHHYVDELENQESARIMGVAPGTATRRRDKGLAMLREALLKRVKHDGESLAGCLKHLLRLGEDLNLAALFGPAAEQVDDENARSTGRQSPGGRP